MPDELVLATFTFGCGHSTVRSTTIDGYRVGDRLHCPECGRKRRLATYCEQHELEPAPPPANRRDVDHRARPGH
jgi:hypothetical protein